jgi:DNA-binding transcriptional ArsR family regulator
MVSEAYMLEELFGNIIIEKILFFLFVNNEGYPLGIARVFGVPVNRIQQQLKRLENGGIIASRLVGNVRLYTFNPRFPFLKELKGLVAKAYEFVPEKEKDLYYRTRKRPRRAGKPL